MKFVLNLTACSLLVRCESRVDVPPSSINYYEYNTINVIPKMEACLLFINNQKYPEYLEKEPGKLKLNIVNLVNKDTPPIIPDNVNTEPCNIEKEEFQENYSSEDFLNNNYFPNSNIRFFLPPDNMILAFITMVETYKLDYDNLKMRLFYNGEQADLFHFYEYIDMVSKQENIMNGYLIHNGKTLIFVSRKKMNFEYKLVNFCSKCGFYVIIDKEILYLNVTVEHVLYLSVVTFLQAYLRMINQQRWPFIACRTADFYYIMDHQNVLRIKCFAGHRDIQTILACRVKRAIRYMRDQYENENSALWQFIREYY